MNEKAIKKYLSIKDIAKKADVSPATVSNALSGNRYVKEETKRRIKKIAEESNYKPNIIASGLRIKKTRLIGVIVPDIKNQFYSQVVFGIEKVCRDNNYNPLLLCTYFDDEIERAEIENLNNLYIDGLIIVYGPNRIDHINEANRNNIPIVYGAREIEKTQTYSVIINNKKAMKEAVNYLYKFGHRKIGYISSSYERKLTHEKRYKGYLAGLKENNLPIDPSSIIIDDLFLSDDLDETYDLYRNYINENKGKITAIITSADYIAVKLLGVLNDCKMKVPEDLSVMGFDNIAISQYTIPPLTTVKQPKEEMGSTAMKLLIELIEKKKIKKKTICLPTKIIERGTVSNAK